MMHLGLISVASVIIGRVPVCTSERITWYGGGHNKSPNDDVLLILAWLILGKLNLPSDVLG